MGFRHVNEGMKNPGWGGINTARPQRSVQVEARRHYLDHEHGTG